MYDIISRMISHRRNGFRTILSAMIAIGLLMTATVVQAQEDPRAKIAALEKDLSQKSAFDWDLHNELRHWYGAVDERTSFYHSDVILRHSPMDDYILNVMAGWVIENDRPKAIQNLHEAATKYPAFAFVAAACWIKAGDLEKEGASRSLDRAASAYRKVLGLAGPELAPYRQLAQKRLTAIGAKDVATKDLAAPNTPEPGIVQGVEPAKVKKASSEKGKAVIGVLPGDNARAGIVTVVPGSDNRVWNGKTLGGFKDFLAGKKLPDDDTVDLMGAVLREQDPQKYDKLRAAAENLRGKLLELGEDRGGVEAKVAQKERQEVQNYLENAPPEEKQKLFDAYAERGAPIDQVWQPAEQQQAQWYQIPSNGDVRQIIRNYAPPVQQLMQQPMQPSIGNAAPSATPSRDVDLAGKIGAFQLILSESVYDHRPGSNGGQVATHQRVITVNDPRLTNQGSQQPAGSRQPGTQGTTSGTAGASLWAGANVNNLAAVLKKASAPRTSNPTARPGSGNPASGDVSRIAEAERQRQLAEQQKQRERQEIERKNAEQQRKLEQEKQLEHQRQIERQKELERVRHLEQQQKELEHEAAHIKAESARIADWRRDLEHRLGDLKGRIHAHNQHHPDSTNAHAVHTYNEHAHQLNQEQATLQAEARRFDEALRQLLHRAQQLDNRAQTLRSQASR